MGKGWLGVPLIKKRLCKVQNCGVGSRGPLKGPGGIQGQSIWCGSRGRSPRKPHVHFNADTAFPTQTYIGLNQIVNDCGMGWFQVEFSRKGHMSRPRN